LEQKIKQVFSKFQFLIGTIKTPVPRKKDEDHILVSIPHRYDKNFKIVKMSPTGKKVSIPHRYDKNLI